MQVIALALKRPYTFVVFAILILILGAWYIVRTPKDIFPDIRIPVVSVVWNYSGLTPEEFEQRITINSEIYLSNYVTGVARIESQTLNGFCIIRLYFHEDVDISSAIGQTTSISQTVLRRMPVGVQPPEILLYSPSTVPIIQMVLSSDSLTEQEILDYAIYHIRPQVAAIHGVTVPQPYGGKVRELMVDVDPAAVQARGLSPIGINAAVNSQSVILPTGDAKIGEIDYLVNLNNTPITPEEYNNFPVAYKDEQFVYLKDIGYAYDGFPPQLNVVHNQNKKAVLLTVLKNGPTSTLEIVNNVKKLVTDIKAAAPKGMEIELLFDQSIFVKAALNSVVIEGVLAALLTSLLMFLFLGSWRTTFIVILMIPLSVLASVICISLMGYTLNLMTLGGLALSIGILVDNAVVTLENIHRNIKLGKSLQNGIFEGASQVILPTFISTIAICIVFIPVSLLVGPSRFLFVPFAFTVVFAILASYILSFTLLPVMCRYLLNEHEGLENEKESGMKHYHQNFENLFERFRKRYEEVLQWGLENRPAMLIFFTILFLSALILIPFIGTNFFPNVDAGQLRLHVYLSPGTRLEVAAEEFAKIEEEIKKVIPEKEIELLVNNIGIPISPFNLAFGDNTTIGTWDGGILISLKSSRSHSTAEYMKKLREYLSTRFPDYVFLFQPADMTSQILNFGLATPIDIRVIGDSEKNVAIAQKIVENVSTIPGAVDVHLHQILDQPELFLNVNRLKLAQIGLKQLDLASNIVIAFSDSTYITPNFWLDRKAGFPYPIAVQIPKYQIDSVEKLMNTPIASPMTPQSELLSNLATLEYRKVPAVTNNFNLQRAYDIYVNIQGVDLGSVSNRIQKVLDEIEQELEPGNKVFMTGMVEDMSLAFTRLGFGFIFAFLFIYFVLVVNFQSWLDPFIIIMAIPGAISGIIWMLFLTHTTFSVPSLMGTIMSLGIAIANSIMVVAFANQLMYEKNNSSEAVHAAASIRLRPVLMTASAMVIGMLPMALALGEGGEQNAPLGRALIGGIIFATFTTLLLVPIIFSYFRKIPNPYLHPEGPS